MSKADRHVVNNPNGGWDVKKPDASRASVHADTQREAQTLAREIIHNQGGGELITHGRTDRSALRTLLSRATILGAVRVEM